MYEDIYAQIRQEAEKRNLKSSTANAYCNTVDYFLRTVNKDISDLPTDDVDAFLTEKRLGGLAPQTYNHYHSSIRFFYKHILKMNWDDDDIPRMKRDHSLPTVLSREEIQSIIDHTPNLKHKAIIATMYSSGLRVSEVVHLHYEDISRKNLDATAMIKLLYNKDVCRCSSCGGKVIPLPPDQYHVKPEHRLLC